MDAAAPASASEGDRTMALRLCNFLVEMHSVLPAERFATLAHWLAASQKDNPVWQLPVYPAPGGIPSPPPSTEGKPALPPSQITPPAKSVHEVVATGKKGTPVRRTGRQRLGPVRLGIDQDASAAAWTLPSQTQIEGLADALGFDGCEASIALLAAAAAGGGGFGVGHSAKRARKPLAPIQAAKRARAAAKSPLPAGESQEPGQEGAEGEDTEEADEGQSDEGRPPPPAAAEPSIEAGVSLLLALQYS